MRLKTATSASCRDFQHARRNRRRARSSLCVFSSQLVSRSIDTSFTGTTNERNLFNHAVRVTTLILRLLSEEQFASALTPFGSPRPTGLAGLEPALRIKVTLMSS